MRPRNDLILDHFGPKTSRPGNLRCPDRALLEAVGLDLVKMSILAYFGPFWRRLRLGPLRAAFVMWHFEQFMVLVKAKYFDMTLFDLLWSVWALQRFLFVVILRIIVNIDKCCVVVVLRPSIFSVYRLQPDVLCIYFEDICICPKSMLLRL